ncbi:MAG: hypothetical protein GF421_06755 [Candidatus Aminicenantes bacterium]|nr:hypothetical protein [Candidatus Aminicenantes bacterium]
MGKHRVHIKTGKKEFDEFVSLIISFLRKARMDMVIDGEKISGYRTPDTHSIWIRDFSDMLRAVKYFETDLKSAVQHFADTQSKNGRIFDYFTVFPEKKPCEKENWTKYVRVPVEADVEYRFIKAAFLAWQATGDDSWLENLYPCMQKAMEYVLKHPWRWDPKSNLVKRAYTIDTWDFAYTEGKHDWLQFQVNDRTFWGIMHGDNSGYYETFSIMAFVSRFLGLNKQSETWEKRANEIRKNMNRICWNGTFYTHFVKLTPVKIKGVNESKQLSLSNSMAINRGAADHEKAVSIIKEYQKRQKETEAFAEWFSIDPPFPDGIFGDDKLIAGAYVNGGIMPLVGGELSRAAFEHGFESYGVDILERYYEMISAKGESYLWYFPDGTPSSPETSTSPEASSSDAWGSSAMLYAFIEGLCGIQDRSKIFQKVKISPRWSAAGVKKAEVLVSYAASEKTVRYTFTQQKGQILLDVECPLSDAFFHVLLPETAKVKAVEVQNKRLIFKETLVKQSRYVDFQIKKAKKDLIRIRLTD